MGGGAVLAAAAAATITMLWQSRVRHQADESATWHKLGNVIPTGEYRQRPVGCILAHLATTCHCYGDATRPDPPVWLPNAADDYASLSWLCVCPQSPTTFAPPYACARIVRCGRLPWQLQAANDCNMSYLSSVVLPTSQPPHMQRGFSLTPELPGVWSLTPGGKNPGLAVRGSGPRGWLP